MFSLLKNTKGPYAAHKEYKTNENLVQPTPTTSTNNNWIKLGRHEINQIVFTYIITCKFFYQTIQKPIACRITATSIFNG